MVVGVLWFGKV
uniref:Uncharacterized protein n=1 Tax=Anguilla anguilla TaxID=7936 RepID=A0A0E9S0J4_ANGAN